MKRRFLKPKNRRSSVKKVTIECKILKFMRKEAGLSIRKAGEKCGVSEAYINHLENGRMDWTEERGRPIVESYGFNMEQFDSFRCNDAAIGEDLVEACIWEIRRMHAESLVLLMNLIRQLRK